MATLTKEQVQKILENAPAGSDHRKIVEGLIARGHTLEGLQIPQAQPTGGMLGKEIRKATETIQDISQGTESVGRELGKAGEEIVTTSTNGDLNLFEKAVQIGAQAFRGGSRAFGETIKGAVKAVLPAQAEEDVRGALKATGEIVASQPEVRKLAERYNALDPETKRHVDNALGYAEGLADILTGGTAKTVAGPLKRVLDTVAREGGELTTELVRPAQSLFTKPASSVDDVISQADSVIKGETALTKATAEQTAPKLSLQEKWAGISPDIKRRIAGKQGKLQEYFDVAHARNNNDTLPTVNEYGAKQAQGAVEQMESLLNDSGGKIGKTREKLGTYQASIDDLAKIENNFIAQLDKLNLEIRNGTVRQKTGTVSKAGTGDITVLDGLYQDLLAVKQSPKLTNLLDLRDAFDARINFAKQAREVSNAVDPLSRQVRGDIANTMSTVVGKSNADEVKRFSDFMSAYRDLKSYTDRQAGGEYLLRLVLSGRGGEARQILEIIKEYTGKDLLDDATMMLIANDVIANSRQQNLFRQDLVKAGLDVASIARGDARGALELLANLAKKYLLDEEKTYLEAAK